MVETIYSKRCFGSGSMVEITQNIVAHKEGCSMVCIAVSLLCGILFASIILPGMPIILGGFLLSLLVLFISRRDRANLKVAMVFAIFLGGMLNYCLSLNMAGRLDMFDGKTAAFECVIIDNPAEKGGYLQYTARVRSVSLEGKTCNCNEKVFLRTDKRVEFKFGDKLLVEGRCSDIQGRRNPGDFDYKLYYKSKGINRLLVSEGAVLTGEGCEGLLGTMLYLSKEKVRNTINRALPPDEASVLIGIITGDRADMDEYIKNAYIKAGLSHILSVSGLHVGFLMLLLTHAIAPFRLDKRLQGIVIMLVLTYYILLIGAPMPSVRALIMMAVLLLGKITGRKYDLLASVSFAAMVILIFKPLAVHDPGFIISFGAIYSIAFLHNIFDGLLRFIPSALRGNAALSLSVWFGLAPVLAYYFNYVSLISILLNIAAVPLCMAITIAGFVGVLTGIVSGTLAVYIFSVDYYLIKLLTYITVKASELPAAGFYIPTLPIYFYCLYYAGIGLFYAFFNKTCYKIYIARLLSAYLVAAAVAFSVYNLPSAELKMVFFDVGQGDGCCIITPDKKAVLVDSGGSLGTGDYYYDVGGKITLPALLHQGIWKIDTVIVSHLHDDHMEGLLSVMEVYSVKNIVFPRVSAGPGRVSKNSSPLMDLCRRKGLNIYYLGKGDSINLGGGVGISFLHPGDSASTDENENSLVGLLNYGDFYALFTGDTGKETEAGLPIGKISTCVIKVPHHGSGNSSSREFLNMVEPKVSIISVGRNNYGHPSDQTLKRLKDAGSMVYRTDEKGAVTVVTDGRKMKVKAVRQ